MLKSLKVEETREAVIAVGNVYSSVIAEKSILDNLKDEFAYEVEDADYIRDAKIKFYMNQNRATKAKEWAEWNGKFSVFNYTKFGTGILADVIMFLDNMGVKVDLIDQMEKPKQDDWREYLHEPKALYEYQQMARKELIRNDFRGVLHASVAFGKTVLASHIISELGVKTVILVDRVEIMKQWVDEINKWFTFKAEKLKGVNGTIWFKDNEPAILLCTSRLITSVHDRKNPPKTMIRRNDLIRKMCRDAGLLIYDEVHHASAKNARRAVTKIKAYHRVGLSGTVNMREDNSDYEYLALIGNVIFSFSATELVNEERGANIDIIVKHISYDPDWIATLHKVREYPLLYEWFILDNDDRNAIIEQIVLDEVSNGSSVLVLVDRVAHARRLAARLGEDIATFTYSADDRKERDEKIEKFKTKQIPTLFCTYALAGEGFDFPELNALVLAGGKSEIKIRQSLGRIMRRKEDGSSATLYDFADPINPFRDHFLDRIKIYNSEEVFVVKEMPRWVKKYV